MGSAILAGVLAAAAVLALGWGRALSNADFIYSCACADVLSNGVLPITPYFPPGYPMLIWLALSAGLNALSAGMLFSALGSGLSAGALAYAARHWGLPPALALCLALLGLSLPSVFEIAFNPQLDALYTGLALCLVVTALVAIEKPLRWYGLVSLLVIGALMLTLRWHAMLVVLPIALLLSFQRERRRRPAGLLLLAAALIVLGWLGAALYVTEGKLELAFLRQVVVGQALREAEQREQAVEQIYVDYGAFIETNQFAPDMLADGIATHFLDFATRRALLLGIALCLIGGIFARRLPPGSLWLLAFVLCYALVLSPTYFTPRASALIELCGLLLAASGLSVLINWQGRRDKKRLVNIKLDPALAGVLLSLVLLCFVGWNAWREAGLLAQWGHRRALLFSVNARAMEETGAERLDLWGPLGLTGWTHSGPGALPACCYSRLWMDDPDVWPLIFRQVPRYSPEDVLSGLAGVRAVLLWPGLGGAYEMELAQRFAADPAWRAADSGADEAKLFVWKNAELRTQNSEQESAAVPTD